MAKKISIIISALLMLMCLSFSLSAYADELSPIIDLSTDSTVSVTLSESTFYYDGTEKKPVVTVSCNNLALKEKTDYTVAYSDNINAGTAKVTISGKGDYTGTLTESYTIKKMNIAVKGMTTVSFEESSLIYHGDKVTPVMYVLFGKDNPYYLVEGIDYTVTYSNINKIGKGTAKLTGIGNYSGSFSKSFNIVPEQVSGLKIAETGTSSVKVSWTKLSGVTGYKIYFLDTKKSTYSCVGTVSSKSNTFTVKNLEPKKLYHIAVRAYKDVDKKSYYSAYTPAISVAVKPQTVSITSVTKDKNKLTIDWNSIKCSGYEIYYTTDKNMKKNIKVVNVSSNKKSYTVKNIDKSKTYYVKMRAYIKVGDKILYSAKSAMVSSYFSNVYASYYSYYENNPNRTTNLKIASKAISGTIIQPGETFDFNKVVGPRNASRGYKPAHVFSTADTVSNEIGGGICQVASTMFNCVLKANVGIVERHQHTQRVAYVPLGRDAAIYGSANNFRWKNTTKYAIQVKMTVKDGKISCTFYTCQKAKPKSVNLKVTQNGKNFTLKRIVDGKTNYSCKSKY